MKMELGELENFLVGRDSAKIIDWTGKELDFEECLECRVNHVEPLNEHQILIEVEAQN